MMFPIRNTSKSLTDMQKKRLWLGDEFLQFVFYDLNSIALKIINVCPLLNQMSVRYEICFFFKFRYVSDTFLFFIGTICVLTIDYCYIHVKGAFVWYIFSFDKILFQSLSSKISCFILSVCYQILRNEKVYLQLKYWWIETDVVHSCSPYSWYQNFYICLSAAFI